MVRPVGASAARRSSSCFCSLRILDALTLLFCGAAAASSAMRRRFLPPAGSAARRQQCAGLVLHQFCRGILGLALLLRAPARGRWRLSAPGAGDSLPLKGLAPLPARLSALAVDAILFGLPLAQAAVPALPVSASLLAGCQGLPRRLVASPLATVAWAAALARSRPGRSARPPAA